MSQQSAPYKLDEMLYPEYARLDGIARVPWYREIEASAGCLYGDPDIAEQHVRVLLRGLEGASSADGKVRFDARIGPIRRVEIFCNEHTAPAQGYLLDKGLVLFDSTYRPIVHVFNALIGYEGSGPSLTKMILDELSIPERIFDEIQKRFRGVRTTDTPYYIVIQYVGGDASPEWEWASVDASVSG